MLAQRDPRTGGILIAAVPLREADQQLDRLLVVEGARDRRRAAACSALAGWVVVRIGLLPLDRMGHTAGRIAGGDLSHRVEATDPRTEVGRLGIALNGMLDRLEDAFSRRQASEDRLRAFIADASHELRTPLASIRGYAELFRMGAVPDGARGTSARCAASRTRPRAWACSSRTCSRSRGWTRCADAPHAELDVAALAARRRRRRARDRARPRDLARRRRRRPVLGDAHQLRQVLGNLLRNALVHTPAGTPIEVSVEPRPDVVRVTVRDHGPGLPTDDPDALFERFWRAEGGRERGKGGAGPRAGDRRRDRRRPRRPRARRANADGGGAAFVVELPALRKL